MAEWRAVPPILPLTECSPEAGPGCQWDGVLPDSSVSSVRPRCLPPWRAVRRVEKAAV